MLLEQGSEKQCNEIIYDVYGQCVRLIVVLCRTLQSKYRFLYKLGDIISKCGGGMVSPFCMGAEFVELCKDL